MADKFAQLMAAVNERMSKLDSSHNMDHVLAVIEHAKRAIQENLMISDEEKDIIFLACLLHDVDDHKYFKDTNFAAEHLEQFPNLKQRVLQCIQLVSTSVNGNEIDPAIPIWMYIPRFADRLEAMGQIGIDRCITYSNKVGTKMFAADTQLATTEDELKLIATPARFAQYKGRSASVIDHFYDKLLHLRIQTGISYIDKEMDNRHQIMVDFVLDQCRKKVI